LKTATAGRTASQVGTILLLKRSKKQVLYAKSVNSLASDEIKKETLAHKSRFRTS
jgi:hypothetical protein